MQPSAHILSAKLRPPGFCDNLTRRPRLEKLLDSTTSKVILVVAPAGFGKTTLLSNWMQSTGGSCAWVTVSREDDDLPQFLNHVVAALAPFHQNASHQEQLASGANDEDDISAEILEEVELSGQAWKLVLDDYQIISNPEIHNFITRLIDVMPDDCRLVIASRTEPPLPIARLRVHGELALVTAADLRATAAEGRAALSALDIEVSALQARAIAERTAGWMTALHLVALAGQSRSIDHVIQLLETFDSELELLREFLLQEVLNLQSPDMQDFLLRISILDRFTVESCHAITGNAASGQLLEHARRNGLFLVALDDSRGWFRFHSLFREFLRRELNLRVDPDSTRQLHLAASRWFAEQNLDDEALVHSVEAGDWSNATKMVKAVAFRLLYSPRVAEILPWLESFPKDVILADPDLSSITAYFLVQHGRILDSSSFLEAAEARWERESNRAGMAVAEMIRGEIARYRDDGLQLCEHGLKSLALATQHSEIDQPPSDYSTVAPKLLHFTGTWLESFPHMIPYVQISLGLILQGKIDDGTRIAEEVLRIHLVEGVDTRPQGVTALVGHAWVASGRLPEAEALLGRTVIADFDDLPVEMAMALVALSEVLYERNHVEACEQLLLEGIEALTQAGVASHASPLQLQITRVRLAQGDLDGAMESLDAATRSATDLQNRRRLNQVEAIRARIALTTGNADQARNWALTRRISTGVSETSKPLQESLVLARLHIASGDVEDAVALLEELRQVAEQNGAQHDLIHILSLLSVAYLDLFELDQAVEVLREALEIGEAGGYIRVFIDEGPSMSRILRIAHRRGLRVHYVNTILEASGETPEELTKFTHSDLVEPITARELDVLRLLALSLTNKEISDELYIAVSTVKRHITNLYGKLGVTSRTEAVQKARKLHLLSAAPEGSATFPESVTK